MDLLKKPRKKIIPKRPFSFGYAPGWVQPIQRLLSSLAILAITKFPSKTNSSFQAFKSSNPIQLFHLS